ncbi:MAG: aldehyde dehydrogenase family protein [Proteobacteria bacterium]|nr:aldehyde dehydrogenase family protein [Pseudomonadota bacterium]
MSKYALIIDGKRVDSTPKTFKVLNPADESVVAEVPEGTVELLDKAVAAARKALPGWSAQSSEARAAKLMEIADLLEKNQAELAQLITKEQGKTLGGLGSNFEVGGAAAWTRVTASLNLTEETIQDDKQGKILLRRKPVGVVGSITPWNWPMIIAVWHIMPAIRIGCTVVIKPSPYTPLSTLRMVELMNSVLPPGVINIVTGDAEVGNRMSVHPGIDKIVFTGSVNTGKKVMGGAANTLKRLTLELGGNDAGIILPGTHIDPLLEKLFWGCFINAGQTCAALKRLYVHSSQYEEVVKKLADYASKIPMGNGLDEKSALGPLSNKMQFDKVSAMVDEARARGARIVIGGVKPKGPGFFYPLTVIADATDDMRVVKEEQFGTVIPILKYETVDEAITRANALEVGLGGSVWGNDPAEAAKIASRLECGTAWVNQHGGLHPMAPFGGVKCSGIGVEFNVDGLKEYTTVQVLNVAV